MTVEIALSELNIAKDEFYAIIADDEAAENIYECLMHCFLNVPDLKEIAATLLQDVVIPITNTDGGPGSGNFGHEGRPGEVGGSVGNTGKKYTYCKSNSDVAVTIEDALFSEGIDTSKAKFDLLHRSPMRRLELCTTTRSSTLPKATRTSISTYRLERGVAM